MAHGVDDALTNFLDVYNPTVLTLYGHFWWFPRIDLAYRHWAEGIIAINLVLLGLTPLAYKNTRWLRRLAWVVAIAVLVLGFGHVLMTITGQTVPSVHFGRPGPGFYSSPLLMAAAIYLMVCLRK